MIYFFRGAAGWGRVMIFFAGPARPEACYDFFRGPGRVMIFFAGQAGRRRVMISFRGGAKYPNTPNL